MSTTLISLSADCLIDIAQYLDYDDIVLCFNVNRQLRELYLNSYFWRDLVVREFGGGRLPVMCDNYRELYLKYAADSYEYYPGAERHITIVQLIYGLKTIMSKGDGAINKRYFNYFAKYISTYPSVGVAIKNNPELDIIVLAILSYTGNLKVLLKHIQQSGLYPNDISSSCLVWAAKGGQTNVVEYMISSGTKFYGPAMVIASKGKHWDIVRLMMMTIRENIIDQRHIYDSVMLLAVEDGQLEIVKMIVADDVGDIEGGHKLALKLEHQDIADYLEQFFW